MKVTNTIIRHGKIIPSSFAINQMEVSSGSVCR